MLSGTKEAVESFHADVTRFCVKEHGSLLWPEMEESPSTKKDQTFVITEKVLTPDVHEYSVGLGLNLRQIAQKTVCELTWDTIFLA